MDDQRTIEQKLADLTARVIALEGKTTAPPEAEELASAFTEFASKQASLESRVAALEERAKGAADPKAADLHAKHDALDGRVAALEEKAKAPPAAAPGLPPEFAPEAPPPEEEAESPVKPKRSHHGHQK